jgi:hypothetical protein
MLQARSLRFGGLLVQAAECDYNSFIEQGLRCPICGGTVFLVRATSRGPYQRKTRAGDLTSVSGSEVVAHFSHHSGTAMEIANCEMRSARLTQVQVAKIKAEARGQIARIFRQKFFGMVMTSAKLDPYAADVGEILDDLWQQASIKQPLATRAMLELLVDMLAKDFATQADCARDGMNLAIDKLLGWIEDPTVPVMYRERFAQWANVLDKRMQALVVREALDFTVQRAQKPILALLVKQGIYNWILACASTRYYNVGQMDDFQRKALFTNMTAEIQLDVFARDDYHRVMVEEARKLIGLGSKEYQGLLRFVCEDIVQILTFVDWADQFDRRDKGA